MRLNSLEKQYWDNYWEELGERPAACLDVVDYDKLDEWLEDDWGGKIVLDVGSGRVSKLSDCLRRRAANLISLDICYGPLSRSNVYNRIQADGLMIPLEKNSIDGTICVNLCNTGLMYNRKRLHGLMLEINRVLKPGGLLIESNYGDLRGNQAGFTRKDHEWLVKVSGFEIVADIGQKNLIKSLEKKRVYQGGAYIARKRI